MNNNKIFNNGSYSIIQKTYGLVNTPVVFVTTFGNASIWSSVTVTPPGRDAAVASTRSTTQPPAPTINTSPSLNVTISPSTILADVPVDVTVSITGGIADDVITYSSSEI